MKSGSHQAGFTIVETLIVLAISGVLFISAAVLISGRQAATQFSQGIRDVEGQVQRVINEVSSGYYPSTQSITCTSTGPNGGPAVRGTGNLANTQGTNKDCIFLGRTIHFAVANDDGSASDPQLYNTYTLVGVRTMSELLGTEGLAPAKPRALARANPEPTATTPDNMFDTQKLPYGLSVVNMYYDKNPDDPAKKVAAVAFTSSLGNLGGADTSQQVNVLAVPGTRLNMTKGSGVAAINNQVVNGVFNPEDGVHVCLRSGGTDKSALLSIGGGGRQGNVTVAVKDSGDCR